ncbi:MULTISPECIES: chromate transporter [unclassified Paenibacillus]|uniref:chromate transporter n=1 Tax=unclassified Paenibacillus TaxID=185978 RepID=UPI0024053384|nr:MULTISPECIES: chromate transporter [unclassified Paenibacillus]MDF9842610.1 chromate transporter [Paenibacillus sp. PastF-2]MDF9849183.1 chromate transporter [Paenibacillus sp. PastM-2]MDF9855771.1 chromate transporter [Paenibacillus sp. PastF-1]MDH6481025.1 chromate transporter [Paenibacillus sp. PastH-2]MDH6508462.1 chromate transporter [Paenibacillus sp. PastM-3]
MLLELFVLFLKVGLISFGGGYAVITLIQREIAEKGWLTTGQFQELVALAGMAPGSIATNTATLIGYSQMGIIGGIVSTIGIILPSLLIVILFTAFFLRMKSNNWVRSSFYGLRPIITGLIVYAAIHFGLGSAEASWLSWQSFGMLLICAASLIAVIRYKIHPFAVILLSAVGGIVLF